MKTCSIPYCDLAGQPQSMDSFHNDKGAPDGKRSICKTCVSKNQKATNARNKALTVRFVPEEKKCAHCEAPKPIADFGLDRTQKDGHQKYCREHNRFFSAKSKAKSNRAKKLQKMAEMLANDYELYKELQYLVTDISFKLRRNSLSESAGN